MSEQKRRQLRRIEAERTKRVMRNFGDQSLVVRWSVPAHDMGYLRAAPGAGSASSCTGQ